MIADLGMGRAGFATSRALGCAARRNRQKRRLKEAFRLEVETRPGSAPYLDWVVMAKSEIRTTSFAELRTEVAQLAQEIQKQWEDGRECS